MNSSNMPVETPDIRYCKKCGCELVSTNKRKLCEHCRRERAEKWRRRGEWALGIAGAAGLVITKFLGSNSSDDAEDPSSQDNGSGTDSSKEGDSNANDNRL